MLPDDAEIMFKCEMSAGHGGASGRYDAWRETADFYAWIIDNVRRVAQADVTVERRSRKNRLRSGNAVGVPAFLSVLHSEWRGAAKHPARLESGISGTSDFVVQGTQRLRCQLRQL